MMNQNVKKLWVEALRSGNYVQGYGRLSTGYAHCCLGVLCDLAVKDGVVTAEGDADGVIYDSEEGLLPYSVTRWAGLGSQQGGRVNIDGISGYLSELNDNGFGFSELADAIEAQL